MSQRLLPREAILAVNHRCNTFCAMCDIWSRPDRNELPPEFYSRLPGSLRNLNISGGEPFMRDDLPEIAAVLRARLGSPRIVISTNGMLTDKIVEQSLEMAPVAIRVSIDGVGEVHDKIRNVEGCFERVVETVRRLQGAGIADLGIACTGSRDNPGALLGVKKLAETLGVDYVCSVVHSSELYFGSQDDMVPRDETTRSDLMSIATTQLRSLRPKDWFRSYYTDGIIDYIDGQPRRDPCVAATGHIHVDHRGVVYPCNVLNQPLGNLNEKSWEDIEADAATSEVLRSVRNCQLQCWMSCTVAPVMKARPDIAARWILGRWFRGATPRAK
ncbi:MAG: radical SAM protein [Gemmatimonadota bacterium]|jgi:MoaA/NifB/PqqE/SkfB family radical SAM enzyme|nr:radical SAM protein [Gemmatimonadota bacterium]MDP6801940.1 radical SAM protein [Gemmatimonadota bacterium]MDP7032361.1 radical SAM protein [Gemmatimonadota bacterium]